jgi:hypothetical protein
MDQKNFVEWGCPQFSERAIEAARHGHLNAEPLLSLLQKTHDVSRGLEQIFKIAQNNRTRELEWEHRDPDDPMEPPIRPNTIESLLALGQVASAMLEIEVGRVSVWLEKHGIQEREARVDLKTAPSIAQQAGAGASEAARAEKSATH